MERVQKIMAQAGVASRRKCEDLIAQGRVSVNGETAILGMKADSNDKILVDGESIRLEKKVYIMLNKPRGYVTTVSEGHDMKTVMDLVRVPERIFPVGRLDRDTEGLLLLTNDGELTQRLTHPSFEVVKEYYVVLDKSLSDAQFNALEKGVVIDDRRVAIVGCEVDGKEVFLSIHEGRKHIVRRLFEELGLNVFRLVRIRVDRLEIGDLKAKQWRFLTVKEVDSLLRSVKPKQTKN